MWSDGVAAARAALAQGDVLRAYDQAVSAAEADPDDLDAHFVVALSLARAGARERARAAADELLARLETVDDAVPRLQEDAAALVARLVKDDALATEGPARRAHLRAAADHYEHVADRFGGHFSCINAATLRLLAGDVEAARLLALRAQKLLGRAGDAASEAEYWRAATAAEAALVLGDVDRAHAELERADLLAGDNHAARAVTRRQLRLVCRATELDEAILDVLTPPLVIHYCGHVIDAAPFGQRFAPEIEPFVVEQVRRYLSSRRVGVAFGSLASGGDIIVAEELTRVGVPYHVVLPFDTEEFERASVAPAGGLWPARFRTCLARAEAIVNVSDSRLRDEELFGYAARVAMGHALNRAAFIDAPVEQLAIWDGVDAHGQAGTAHDVRVWRAAGHRTHVIPIPPATEGGEDEADRATPSAPRRIAAILFTDLRGYSRLRDEQIPTYVSEVLTPLATTLTECGGSLLWANTWGDAIAAVFADVAAGAEVALALHDTLARIDMAAIGFPADLHLRIGGHAGPVIPNPDPVTGIAAYWGRELTRAARIEPRTPEGQVYVTDAFAALLALEPDVPFTTEYMGRITTAKDFETIPMYRLERRAG